MIDNDTPLAGGGFGVTGRLQRRNRVGFRFQHAGRARRGAGLHGLQRARDLARCRCVWRLSDIRDFNRLEAETRARRDDEPG
ncbi:MAG: hypothetical protein DCF16_17600 [Alphaproteobacteria bacterium]|nr:MAG: hypothetical protein DCF16_17600 [Alphaproteobacteria bacterium]